MKAIIAIILLCTILPLSSKEEKAAESIPEFLTVQQKNHFYELMVQEIERIDAEIIETRNHAKSVKWNDFTQHYRKLFEKATSWKELYQAFQHFSQGLVNLHTRTKFLAYKPQKKTKNNWLNDKVLFEYPANKYYLASNKFEITHLNQTPILEAFEEFSNHRCRHNNQAGCVDMFSVYLQAGAIKADGKDITEFTIASPDGKVEIISAEFNAKPIASTDPFADKYCSTHQGYKDFDLIFSGKNVCLYRKLEVAVLRIRNFKYQDQDESDIYCQKQQGAFCQDIHGILEQLHLHKPSHLIFDVIQNFGGNENTKFLAAFMPNNFQDLPVMYKNTDEMHDATKRRWLLWDNPAGEKWYQAVKDNKQEYFPIRGDFCRGKNGCHLSLIKPNPKAYVAEKVSIMSDWMCVSSCDDFVWRMQQFAGAKLYGISPAQDATYARARILLYLDKKGKVSTVVTGESYNLEIEDMDFQIAALTIPYSKTVDLDGKLRNIQSAKLVEVPYALHNQENYPQAVLDRILN
ncbi:MAG: hypothetical protein HWD86_06915 [Kangiellaceae bacterium]|nr:hypothetical protein [Kangiellaceae bacterium]